MNWIIQETRPIATSNPLRPHLKTTPERVSLPTDVSYDVERLQSQQRERKSTYDVAAQESYLTPRQAPISAGGRVRVRKPHPSGRAGDRIGHRRPGAGKATAPITTIAGDGHPLSGVAFRRPSLNQIPITHACAPRKLGAFSRASNILPCQASLPLFLSPFVCVCVGVWVSAESEKGVEDRGVRSSGCVPFQPVWCFCYPPSPRGGAKKAKFSVGAGESSSLILDVILGIVGRETGHFVLGL
ncbi:hypothetical protein F4780DRAFT_13823 [Xylariomycetidae sp. FL0641]|nr:hypothetical protein F4780DRAFT_13823 [Xylariomycetidae sp. FL0641]